MKGAIRYRVTVSAVVERTKQAGREWAVVENVPDPTNPGQKMGKFGYTPAIEKTVEEQVPLFDQQVERLDMAALVLVVNGITSGPLAGAELRNGETAVPTFKVPPA